MELRPPRQKYRKESVPDNLPLPFRQKNEEFSGYFNGFSVIVSSSNDARELVTNGCFGKPQFSRTLPSEQTEILRKRQHINRTKYPFKKDLRPKKVIVVTDSDSGDNDDYFTNLKPTYAFDKSIYKNSLVLSLVEAYFLSVELECLKIQNINNIWGEFNEIDPNFVINYAVYLHFRAKNWVVKSGVKFGGDFLLYKLGPAYYHASYIVIIDVIDENFRRIDNRTKRSMDYKNLVGLNRLCETTGKELIICQVMWPTSAEISSAKDINKLSINEVVFRRYILSQS